MAHGAHHQVAQRVITWPCFGHNADAQAQAHVGLDHVGVNRFKSTMRGVSLRAAKAWSILPRPVKEGW